MAFRLPSAPFELALRENPELAKALNDADPFALATTRESLDAWVERLDSLGIWHSPIIRASRGYAMGFRDPDGLQIRLYAEDAGMTKETGNHVQVRELRSVPHADPAGHESAERWGRGLPTRRSLAASHRFAVAFVSAVAIVNNRCYARKLRGRRATAR